MRTISLWCLVVTALAATAASANLVANGSFESGVNPGYFTTLYAANSTRSNITGWTVTLGSIDYIGTCWPASDGLRSIDLSGSGRGAIVDPFDTIVNTPYLLEFDLAGNPAGGPTVAKVKTVLVTVGRVGYTPSISQQFTFDTTGYSLASMGWAKQSLLFDGFGGQTEITFASLSDSAYGPALDNVRVNAVPEPMSIMLGIMGLGSVAGFRKLRRK